MAGYIKLWRSALTGNLFKLGDFGPGLLFIFLLLKARWAPDTPEHGTILITQSTISEAFSEPSPYRITKAFQTLFAAKMLTKIERGHFHITNFDQYQTANQPKKSADEMQNSGSETAENLGAYNDDRSRSRSTTSRKRDQYMDDLVEKWMEWHPKDKPPYRIFGMWRSKYGEALVLEISDHAFTKDFHPDPEQGEGMTAYLSKILASEKSKRDSAPRTPDGKKILADHGTVLELEGGEMRRKA